MRSKQNRLSRAVADFGLVRPHPACDTIDRHILHNRASAVFGLCQARASAKVEPVINQGVQYVAPNDDGRRAYIEAWDVRTNKKVWELTVFTNPIDPKLEEDVQWVFIDKLRVQHGTLMVTSNAARHIRLI